MKRYGCIYKSKDGRDYLVTTNMFNEANASSDLQDGSVLAFHSPKAIAKFMKNKIDWTGNPNKSRYTDGEYRVIELEPVYALVNWKVKGED